MNVDVYILCAGRGSRLGPLTETQPKCLVPFLGQPLLDYQLDVFRKKGIENIHLITGYAHNALTDCPGRKIHNSQWATTNMLQSLLLCLNDSLENTNSVLISYSDIVFTADCLEFLSESPEFPTIPVNGRWKTLWQARMESPEEDAESLSWNTDGILQEIGNPINNLESVPAQFMGLLYLPETSKRQWQKDLEEYLMPMERKHDSTTEFLQFQTDLGEAIHITEVDGGWLEVDSTTDLEIYEKLHREGRLKVVSGWHNE